MPFATDDQSILEQFPFETTREGQISTIRFILDAFNKGKKFVIIEAPCGAGKSPIGIGVAGFFDSSYYLTIQKILQDQLVGEFGEGGKYGSKLIDLKGRSSYECPYYKLKAPELHRKKVITLKQFQEYQEYHDCADGHCRRKGQYRYDECMAGNICTYYNQIGKAISSSVCLMNFAGFLSQTRYTKNFGNRKLMIIDEGHNIESQLLSFISLTLDNSDFPGVALPNLDSPEEYATWLQDNDIALILEQEKQSALFAQKPKRADEIDGIINRISYFIDEMAKEDRDRWVHEFIKTDKSTRVIFKPVYVRKQANNYLFKFADHILIMSATILNVNVMVRSLGIEKDQVAALRIKSRFPAENHPIIYRPAAKVSGGPSQQGVWGPLIIDAVNKICTDHIDHKGIIHTHNFKIAEMLIQNCTPQVKNRMLFQRNFRTKTELIEYHRKMPDTIIVAPAMHEGLDLADDDSRFQIICKVPFPNFFDDKQLAARKEDDEQYYVWLTALKLTQSLGRSVRSEVDWATTYIIDKSFEWWYSQNKAMLPSWFVDSVKFE